LNYRKKTGIICKIFLSILGLEDDPHEVKNLAENPKYAKVLGELKEQLKAFQKRTKDPWIVKWQYE